MKNSVQVVKYSEKTAEEVLAELKTSPRGLNKAEARRRLLKFGKNEIAAQKRRSVWLILISQFKSPLVLILVAASLVAGFLGDIVSTVIIIFIVVFSAVLAFAQEYKSEKAIQSLRQKVALKAMILRDGQAQSVEAAKLVPGDIVFLDLGKVVPADLRLIKVDNLLIDESILTGESFPAEKIDEPLALKDYLPQEAKNLAFNGTHVVQGSGQGVVIATGKKTEFGRVAHLLQVKPQETEFQKGIRNLGLFLLKIILIFTFLIFLFLAGFKHQWLESLLFALAIAVGVSPELLPIIITINLSRGAQKLSRKEVIVKRLMSVEDLGNIDILCTDKTGTLTQGKIVLQDYFDLADKRNPEILKYALVCNSLNVVKDGVGNPLDQAIVGAKESPKLKKAVGKYQIAADLPFDFVRRRMSVVAEQNGQRMFICKGAIEEVLSICRGGKSLSGLKSKFLNLEEKGWRLLLVAMKEIEEKESYSAFDESNLELVGYLAFADEPKDTAKEALSLMRGLGVEIKILTGDSSAVALHLCEEVGLSVNSVHEGRELEEMTDQELGRLALSANLFTKITPEHKLRIINVLKTAGHTVGFLGDGVNDAPALRAADVGISVDSAVDVAKEAADVVLLRKSLKVLVAGIREGRCTFGNTLKYIFSTISSNYGNMFSVAGAALILPYIPLLPTQILLLNFLSDFPMLAVSADRVDEEDLKKPKHWDIKLIRQVMIRFGLLSSFFDFLTFGFLLLVVRASPSLFQTGWFLESFLTEVIIIFVIRTRKGFWQSRPSRLLVLASILTTVLVLAFIFLPLGKYFQFTAPNLKIIGGLVAISAIYFLVVEGVKKSFYRRFTTDYFQP